VAIASASITNWEELNGQELAHHETPMAEIPSMDTGDDVAHDERRDQ